ncbi:immunoglobulin superfamily DCC subclass member 3-like [Hyperolius riggenbachi]|uniref:immunoglobulin superfamily DCC subclass member 3-like n=1 Tax=Hyperolius riggenbachi TaxID=752182 RepID=UPI0035A3C0AB
MEKSYQAAQAFSGDLSFLQEPADAVAIRHQVLILHCLAEGQQPISISWYKNGEPLPPSSYIQQLLNGSLWIRNFQKRQRNGTDEGEYSCAAQNRYGRLLSRKARVQLAYLSRFHRNPQPMAVAEGSVARFQCLTTAVPKATIIWERNRTELVTADPRFTLLPDGILQISGVTKDDVGVYRCLATNPANSRYSDEAWLTLTGSAHLSHQEPVILSGPQNLTLTVHQTAILECIATGNPRPIVSWSRLDGRSIGVEGIQVLGNGNLMISDVSVKHSGVYVCAANRPGTRVRRTAQGMLLVQAPPEFIAWPQSATYAPGDNASFSCVVEGVPQPTLAWLKNGKYVEVRENTRLSDNNRTLTILRVTYSDEALYQCIAENSAGTNQASARLAISLPQDAPKLPEKVIAFPITSTAIQVAWNRPSPADTDGIIGYVLHIRRAEDPSTQETQEALSKMTFKHKLMNLEPSTKYALFLRVYSPVGISRDSGTIFVTTRDIVPKTPDFSVTTVNDTSIRIDWEGAPPSSTIQGYKLEYRKMPCTSFQGTQILPRNQTSFIYYDLEPSSLYQIRLVAFGNSGDGNDTHRFVSLRRSGKVVPDPSPDSEEEHKPTLGLIFGVCVGLACPVLCLLLLFLLYWKRHLCKRKTNEGCGHNVQEEKTDQAIEEERDRNSEEPTELLSVNPTNVAEADSSLGRDATRVKEDQSHEPPHPAV